MIADHTTTYEIQKRMMDCTRKLHSLAGPVGAARQIRAFNTRQQEAALSLGVVKAMKEGADSVAQAERIAQASPDYIRRMAGLEVQLADAEKTIAEWTATMCSYEAARSLLSFNKETLKTLEG